MDSRFPSFPFLARIELSDINASNLYGLLQKAAETLTTLHLFRVKTDPPSKFFPGGEPKDQPPVLVLPRLKSIKICDNSPILWEAPTSTSSNFTIHAPHLLRLDFGKQSIEDDLALRSDMGDVTSRYHPSSRIMGHHLILMFRTSPQLEALSLSGTGLSLMHLKNALPFAPTTLKSLRLNYSATDELVSGLNLPELEFLDVSESISVTIQALSRFVFRQFPSGRANAMEIDSNDHSERGPTSPRLTIITRKPFVDDPASPPVLPELKSTLRTILLSLSLNQLDHLSNSVELNSTPGSPDFAAVKNEIVKLGLPIPPPSCAENRAMGKEMKRMVATEEILRAAKEGLRKWQIRKEQEAAIAWVAESGKAAFAWEWTFGVEDNLEEDDFGGEQEE